MRTSRRELELWVAPVILVVLHAFLFWSARGGGLAGYADFSAFYGAGHILKDGRASGLYDYQEQGRVQARLFSKIYPSRGPLFFNHPPFESLLFVPLAYLSYFWAYVVWAGFGLLVLFLLPLLLAGCLPVLALACSPQTRCILLVEASEPETVVNAFRAGAKGIFCRAGSFESLCKCIATVNKGQVWANSAELQFVLEVLARAAPLQRLNEQARAQLTKREEEVVGLVAQGLSNREISSTLNLSAHTVKNYLFRIFKKLGVSSRVELVLYALDHSQLHELPPTKKPARVSPHDARGGRLPRASSA